MQNYTFSFDFLTTLDIRHNPYSKQNLTKGNLFILCHQKLALNFRPMHVRSRTELTWYENVWRKSVCPCAINPRTNKNCWWLMPRSKATVTDLSQTRKQGYHRDGSRKQGADTTPTACLRFVVNTCTGRWTQGMWVHMRDLHRSIRIMVGIRKPVNL